MARCERLPQGFFTLDLVATIPIDYVSFAVGTGDTSLLTASRSARVHRLVQF